MKKKSNSGGFTLVETLTAMVILVMLIGVVSIGVDTAVKSYRSLTFISESDLLSATVQTALSDILRYAEGETSADEEATGITDEEPAGRKKVFITNENYGMIRGEIFLQLPDAETGTGSAGPGTPESGTAEPGTSPCAGRIMVNSGSASAPAEDEPEKVGDKGRAGDTEKTGETAKTGTGEPDGSSEARVFSLVNDGAYTSMKITKFTILYDDGLFSGEYVIESASGQFKKTKTYAFRSLKTQKEH